MKLREIAHARTGDKGNKSNIAVIACTEEAYELLKKKLTAEVVIDFFSEICFGEVKRYEVDSIWGFNFVMENALGGGVTRSLAVDKHGKSLGMALLELDISI
ncbi:MAG: hypothetical protein E7234_06895 [Lachnospiraceae bacterium]|nr:hypothetical protein [Lachnospiraceae bacterium]